ncbi:MAG: PEP-CTERM sorting domain-containing protein [Gammaproteobacteria bacterium]|nr:PEP-CTERM sorting domain-containing protein [Gammaproteobacteria bacterium]
MNTQRMNRSLLLLAGLLLSISGSSRAALWTELYVGIDGRDLVPSGTYAGLVEPNQGRLTLLFNHGNHYHPIGAYSYQGEFPDPLIVSSNTNNRIPETYTGDPPLPLAPGTGLYTGKLVTSNSDAEYHNLNLRSVDELSTAAPGSEADILYRSSGERWTGSLAGTDLLLQLVSISDGLHVGSDTQLDLFDAGEHDVWRIGEGDSLDFTMSFWTEAGAAPGTYSVAMRLLDANGLYNPSGTFNFDVAVAPVPLPASLMLLLCALVPVLARRNGRHGR